MFDFNHLHPMIVHFPIALLIVGFLSDAIGLISKKEFFTRAGFYLLLLGTIGVVSAYLTGNYAGEGVSETGALKQALETHENAATLSLWLIISAALIRIAILVLKKYTGIFKWVAFFIFFLSVISIARTGFYGGELVYKHAAGVSLDFGFGNLDSTNSDNYTNNDED